MFSSRWGHLPARQGDRAPRFESLQLSRSFFANPMRVEVTVHDLCTHSTFRRCPALGMAAKARHVAILCVAWRRWHLDPGAVGRASRVLHEFFAWLFRGRASARRHTRLDDHLWVWRTRTSWRELHPNHCGVRGGNERDGGGDSSHVVVGIAAAADVAAHFVHALYRYVRR